MSLRVKRSNRYNNSVYIIADFGTYFLPYLYSRKMLFFYYIKKIFSLSKITSLRLSMLLTILLVSPLWGARTKIIRWMILILGGLAGQRGVAQNFTISGLVKEKN